MRFGGPGQHGAGGRAQSLGETEHHGVGGGQISRDGHAGGVGGVEDAGAIHVDLDAALVRAFADLVDGFAWDRRCRPSMLCVFSIATRPVGAE